MFLFQFSKVFLSCPHCRFFRCLRALLNRGVQQGRPLSGLLFLLGIELLNLAILGNNNVKGIKIGDEEVKITLCGNDTALFLRDLPSVNSSLEILDQFKNYSGLELKKTKAEAMWLGSWADRSDTPFGLQWPIDSIQALEIFFVTTKMSPID